MQSVFSAFSEVTVDALTEVLKHAGTLPKGHVTAIETRPNAAFNSAVIHLNVTYSADAPASTPQAFVLKLNAASHGQNEVSFYKLSQNAGLNPSVLVPCFSAAYEPETGNSHLLLLDVSATHKAPVERGALLSLNGVPNKAHREGVVEALAEFHAAWWEHPRLGESGPTAVADAYRDRAAFDERWEGYREAFAAFARQAGDPFPADVLARCSRVLNEHAKLWTCLEPRVTALSGLTLTHNDCYLTQFLSPQTERTQTYLVDFQDVCTDFAARDLVYLLATFWTAEQRHRYERELLELYYRTLVQRGVAGYSFDELWQDYRLMLTYMMFQPVWDFSYGAAEAYWKPKMQCLTSAYDDLRCADLLGA